MSASTEISLKAWSLPRVEIFPLHGNFATLPSLALLKVAEHLDDFDRVAFASTCKTFHQANKDVLVARGRWGIPTSSCWMTSFKQRKVKFQGAEIAYTLDWYKWAYDLPTCYFGATKKRTERTCYTFYNTDLLLLAAFQGSFEAIIWLINGKHFCPIGARDWECIQRAQMGNHVGLCRWLKQEMIRESFFKKT